MDSATVNLAGAMKPEAQAAIGDAKNWSEKHVPEICAVCKGPIGEDEVPLILWARDGKYAIAFHVECAMEVL